MDRKLGDDKSFVSFQARHIKSWIIVDCFLDTPTLGLCNMMLNKLNM
jgi:hypothetical protein